ncbi:8-oxo-dGTP diphosphatase [Bacillus pakistanensis]|uniref:8-oxo-dGTP diphosphatase n=1 Tax=Rossellomorea pakistanensis TaxID=992288 RepID=A0ABS2N7Z4_9BACI|nr:NUDIX domain-containing protein [Bacillus pakistanensis]MBM7583948.1 8-oxo-dGTP diphosphatase [Bacillus pakistanensis]
MKVVFGEKIGGLDYQYRKSVYAIIFNSTKDKVLTVETKKGHHFLPGGGIDYGEGLKECLAREMLEETGYSVSIGSFIGNAMRYFHSTNKEPILNDGYFYLAELLDQVQKPIEDDHFIKWIDINSMGKLLFHEHHFWAVKEGSHNEPAR